VVKLRTEQNLFIVTVLVHVSGSTQYVFSAVVAGRFRKLFFRPASLTLPVPIIEVRTWRGNPFMCFRHVVCFVYYITSPLPDFIGLPVFVLGCTTVFLPKMMCFTHPLFLWFFDVNWRRLLQRPITDSLAFSSEDKNHGWVACLFIVILYLPHSILPML